MYSCLQSALESETHDQLDSSHVTDLASREQSTFFALNKLLGCPVCMFRAFVIIVLLHCPKIVGLFTQYGC